jgi:hypothetical protein
VSKGTYLCSQRTDLIKSALEVKADYLLFIDSDMRFPKDTLTRLLKHHKDIIGANCKHRTADKCTAIKDGKEISSKDRTGIEEIDSLGFGVTLISLEVFEKVPEVWFATPYDGEKFVGEDRYFYHQAKQNGFQIWIDHDLSKEVKHSGYKEYTF